VLRRFPVRCAAQMRAAPEDYKDAVGFANHPDAVLSLEALIHARLEIRRVPDFENCAGFEKCARKEKAEEHQKISGEKTPNATPDNSAPQFGGGRDFRNSGLGGSGFGSGLGSSRGRRDWGLRRSWSG